MRVPFSSRQAEVVEQHRVLLPQAEIQIMPNAAHPPFRDDPSSFNRRLSAFADEIRGVKGMSAVGVARTLEEKGSL